MVKPIRHVLLFSILFSFVFCAQKDKELPFIPDVVEAVRSYDLRDIIDSDTLRVGIMPGAVSYFKFRKETLGYNYELISGFAKHLKLRLHIEVVDTETELVDLLSEGKVDIVAYVMYETRELKENFHFVYPHAESHQVLVQRLGRNSLLDAVDLAGKDVHVKANTTLHSRLVDFNEEIGGAINIILANDSLTNDDLIEMVLENKIQYTTAYYDNASIHRIYQRQLDYHVPVGFAQHSGWLMRRDTPDLQSEYETWASSPATQRLQQRLESKYKTKNPYLAGRKLNIPEGSISPYDDLFKKYAPQIGWDWRLLASVAFHESTFDSARVSRAGASGLMQLMPRTAKTYSVEGDAIFNPEENIRASVGYMADLNKMFRQVKNKDERIKFILAAYNGGPYHVKDAMALAQKYGRNPYVWYDNVEYFLDKKRVPEFYKDSVVKHGSFNARETVRYVENTLSTYDKYLEES
ncbi:lytic transglycosylase F [Paludibacter sp. 221]|uniref:transglycosylase SLT domain-containing protein n=1 Tax=Paludibacter sp. 221 TaxID=2302939 RepID=UPI0013D71E25|nr:transglycosylase SLT domain-containing protein [Paludibacter sp. 221]NDV46984.1 lytic transglycosylase F [Paludibacter sp. 221]